MNEPVLRKEGRLVKDPEKVQKVHSAYKAMLKNAKGVKIKVTYDVGIEFADMGYVTVKGKWIAFDDPVAFVDEVKKASSFEFWARDDGTIEMNFSYNKLLVEEM